MQGRWGGMVYGKQKIVYHEMQFGNDVGYLPDGTPMNKAGNCNNHPENQGPDLHKDGSELPKAIFINEVGYLPDGTPMHQAGNCNNHPERQGPDLHTPGAPLPPPFRGYINDIGYLPDGTDMKIAGNNFY